MGNAKALRRLIPFAALAIAPDELVVGVVKEEVVTPVTMVEVEVLGETVEEPEDLVVWRVVELPKPALAVAV